jgi:hypothetical protein
MFYLWRLFNPDDPAYFLHYAANGPRYDGVIVKIPSGLFFCLLRISFAHFALRQRMQSKLEQQVVSKGAASNGSPAVLCVVTDSLPADGLLFANQIAEFLLDKVGKALCVMRICCMY